MLQMRLMKSIQQAILEEKFPEFVRSFMNKKYKDGNYPKWTVDALAAVNISL